MASIKETIEKYLVLPNIDGQEREKEDVDFLITQLHRAVALCAANTEMSDKELEKLIKFICHQLKSKQDIAIWMCGDIKIETHGHKKNKTYKRVGMYTYIDRDEPKPPQFTQEERLRMWRKNLKKITLLK